MKYTYAVARIRSKEMNLFSNQTIEALMACKTEKDCLAFLAEKGWGTGDKEETADKMLSLEHERTWQVLKELVSDKAVYDVLALQNEFHNVKAAIKAVYTGNIHASVFYKGTALNPDEVKKMIEQRDFVKLPESMREATKEATETLLQTGDGQLCDIIMDKACLEGILKAASQTDSSLLKDYAESTVAIANIKIAVRSYKTNKSIDFMKRAMAPCKTLDVERLAKSVQMGMSALCEYLEYAGYGEGADALLKSPSAFECWCDNRVIQTIKPQKYNSFTSGPIVAYVLARENEIKTVRIILSGKRNGLSESYIRERVREMYV